MPTPLDEAKKRFTAFTTSVTRPFTTYVTPQNTQNTFMGLQSPVAHAEGQRFNTGAPFSSPPEPGRQTLPPPTPAPVYGSNTMRQFNSPQEFEAAKQALGTQPQAPMAPSPAPVIPKNLVPSPSIAHQQPVAPMQPPMANAGEEVFPGLVTRTVPKQYTALIHGSAQQAGVPPEIIAAILTQEGGFNPKARNNNGDSVDRGIAQINNKAHPDITDQQADDPNFAIPWLAQQIAANIKYFGGDLSKAIAAYNVGKGGASVQGRNPFGGGDRGQAYVDRVIRNLSPELISQLNLKGSQALLKEKGLQ